MAQQIASWAERNLYLSDEHRFMYQQGRFRTKSFTLMRWCQAWMARAYTLLGETLRRAP